MMGYHLPSQQLAFSEHWLGLLRQRPQSSVQPGCIALLVLNAIIASCVAVAGLPGPSTPGQRQWRGIIINGNTHPACPQCKCHCMEAFATCRKGPASAIVKALIVPENPHRAVKHNILIHHTFLLMETAMHLKCPIKVSLLDILPRGDLTKYLCYHCVRPTCNGSTQTSLC